MWQSPDLKRRAQMVAQRAKEREKRRGGFRLRKTIAELKANPPDEPPILSSAQVLLNDITPQGMHLFSDYELLVGEFVQITLSHPRRIFVRARVTFCQEIQNDNRVISAQPFPFRTTVIFMFSSEEEEKEFRSFAEELAKSVEAA